MKINIVSFKAQNFLSIQNEVEFHTQNGIDVVVAKNGSGKSAIFLDILYFALFGESYRGSTQKQIINRHVKKNCLVEITFVIDHINYKIQRGLAPQIFNIFKNDELISNLPSYKENQNLLENIINMNKIIFNNICLLNSDFTRKWLYMSMKEKSELILYITDYTFFKNVKNQASKHLVELNNEISMLEYKQNTLINQKMTYDEKMKEIQAKKDDDKKTLIQSIQNLSNELSDLKIIEEQRMSIIEKYQEFDIQINKRKSIINAKIDEINNAQQIECPKCGEIFHLANISKMKDDVNEMIQQFRDDKNALKKLKNDIEQTNNAHIEYEKTRQELLIKQSELHTLEQKTTNYIHFEEDINKINNELSQIDNKLSPMLKKRENINKLLAILKSEKIKQYLTHQLQTFNQIINNIYKIFDVCNEYKIVIDGNFNIKVIKNNDEINHNTFSSGEKTKLSFAILLAFVKHLEYKNNNSFNILVMDEILDSALDYDGREILMKYLYSVDDKNIIIVSHNDDIINVEETINRRFEVVKTEKGTKLCEIC